MIVFSIGTHIIRQAILALMISTTASAFSYKMNAMCFLPNGSSIRAFNPTEQEIKDSGSRYVKQIPTNVTQEDLISKFRLASLSKILVTHWAVATLGPAYRFKTKLSVTPTNTDKSCHVHISGDRDIFMGKEILSHVFSQLKPILAKQDCIKLGQLSFDENFVVPFYSPDNLYIVQHRESPQYRGYDPELFYGHKTTIKALNYFFRKIFRSLNVNEITLTSSTAFKEYIQTVPVKTFSFSSRPLHMMMREFNAYSSNIPPNILFERLGGTEKFKEFIKNRLGFETNVAEIVNGSGYPVLVNGEKRYNEISCAAFVRILQDLDHMLQSYPLKKYQMAEVMAVGGNGEVYSTFKSLYESDTFDNTLVGKTGSADRAITFGGMLSTTAGNVYFAVLTEPDSYEPDQLNRPRTYIRDLVSILAERFVLQKFNYQQQGLMVPFDSFATLVEEASALKTKLK